MAGILDKNTQILDFILTAKGRELLSKNKFNVKYWAIFDDGIDYDPYVVNSASLDADQLESEKERLIEDSFVLEAIAGYKDGNAELNDEINVRNFIFSVPQGQKIAPDIVLDNVNSTVSASAVQRRVEDVYTAGRNESGVARSVNSVDIGFRRQNGSQHLVRVKHREGVFSKGFSGDTFSIRVFKSGSSVYDEMPVHIDRDGNVVFGNEIMFFYVKE